MNRGMEVLRQIESSFDVASVVDVGDMCWFNFSRFCKTVRFQCAMFQRHEGLYLTWKGTEVLNDPSHRAWLAKRHTSAYRQAISLKLYLGSGGPAPSWLTIEISWLVSSKFQNFLVIETLAVIGTDFTAMIFGYRKRFWLVSGICVQPSITISRVPTILDFFYLARISAKISGHSGLKRAPCVELLSTTTTSQRGPD